MTRFSHATFSCLPHDLSQFGFYDDNETVVEMQHQDVSQVTESDFLSQYEY